MIGHRQLSSCHRDGRCRPALLLVLIGCLMVEAPVAHAQATGRIEIRVVDASGAPVIGATAHAQGLPDGARTGSDGVATMGAVPAGAVTLLVRRMGYEPVSVAVEVPRGGLVVAEVSLAPAASVLAPVRVSASPLIASGRLAGFTRRRAGGKGRYIGRERLDQAHGGSLLDIIRGTPGVRVVSGGRGSMGPAIRFRGASCAPLVFIDGVPASAGEFELQTIEVGTVEGIELYASMSSIPAEFLGPRGLDRCGVVAVWSRPYRPRADRHRRVAAAKVPASLATAYPADSVDVAAVLEPGSAIPVYPDSLWRARRGGRVVAEFVVDTVGAAEMETFTVLSSSAMAFEAAVREAVARATFTPATIRARAVRQIVHLPFDFVPEPVDVPAPDPARRWPAPVGASATMDGHPRWLVAAMPM